MKKLLCTLCALLTLGMTVITPIPVGSTASLSYTAEAQPASPDADVTFAPAGTDSTRSLGGSDVMVAQIFLTGDAVTLSLPVDGNGSVRVSLFPFVEDYDTSLLCDPVADHIFTGLSGKSYLTFTFPAGAPLSAGEYLVVLYDAAGVSAMTRGGHASQRCFVNGTVNSGLSLPVSVKYKSLPPSLYGTPTVPQVVVEYDPAPHMGSVMYFDSPDGVSVCGGINTMTVTYTEEDGESFTRFKPSTDAGDPYAFLNIPGTPVKTSEYKYLLIKVRLDADAPRQGQMFFITDECNTQEAASLRFTYAAGEDWQYVLLNLGANRLYTGQLTALRFDVFTSVKGSHYADVAYMALFKTEEAARAFHDNFEDYREEEPVDPGETTPDYSTYADCEQPAPAGEGQLAGNGKLNYKWKEYTHTMDMSETVDDYMAGDSFGFYSLENAIILDGQLRCRAFGSYAFFTKEMVGDNYGLRGGSLSFDTVLSYGSLTVTLRQIVQNDSLAYSGIAFTLTPDGHISVQDRDGFTADFDTGVDLSALHRLTFADNTDSLSVLIDGQTVCTIQCDPLAGTLSDGVTVMSAPHLPGAGYATVKADRARGYIDNVSYTHIDVVPQTAEAPFPTDYSTWVATDDLGRTTPTQTDTPDEQKYVGIFYFMCHTYTAGRHTNDVTRMYLEDGFDSLCATLSSYAGRNGAYWSEPYFGYYTSADAWVYRKHAYMLDAAGVDFIFLDMSNNVFYTDDTKVLFDTWLEIRREGGHTPQICFMFGDMPFTFVNGIYTMLPFLENPEYQELLFRWEGKPLILGNNDGTGDNVVNGRFRKWTVSATTPQSREQFTTMLNDNTALKEFYDTRLNDVLETLTVRKCWAWQAGRYDNYWDWLQNSPQDPGKNADGTVEQMAVAMGTHAHTNRGRSLTGNDTSYNDQGEFGFTLGTAKYGYFFAEQFEYALTQDVQVIMITGWNEWYAGVMSTPNQDQITGGTSTPGYYMVDQMSPEYSRDGEPMRIRDGVGFGDNYYYQMVSYIRRFKGITPPATVNGGTLTLDAADMDAQWENIQPVFTDTVGDIALRSDISWATEFRYVNGTARNDIAHAKISQDNEKLYFYVVTATPLITVDDPLWMNLYLNADNDPTTGWEGYDFLINRSRTDRTVSVERFVDGKWQFEAVGQADYVLGESSLMIALDKTLVGGKAGEAMSFTFKWADHADVAGDVMRFMELGDTAPNDRFAFAYTASGLEDERQVETETETETETDTEADTGTETGEETAPATDTPTGEVPTETDTAPARGCASTVTAGGLVGLGALLAGAACIRRKKEKN